MSRETCYFIILHFEAIKLFIPTVSFDNEVARIDSAS